PSSRSPTRGYERNGKSRNRSRSPAPPSRRVSSAPKNGAQVFGAGTSPDSPSACAICLGRHRHDISRCSSETLWDGNAARCKRNERGRLVNPEGIVICSDWQRPRSCSSESPHHIHECS
ncbi:hypothetical protein BJ912DRAFT_839910, partial [Pholiota molesta]